MTKNLKFSAQTLKDLKRTLKFHARALGLPSGAADVFIEKTIAALEKSFPNSEIITKQDFSRAVTRELKKYHADLAYVYQNYDKII